MPTCWPSADWSPACPPTALVGRHPGRRRGRRAATPLDTQFPALRSRTARRAPPRCCMKGCHERLAGRRAGVGPLAGAGGSPCCGGATTMRRMPRRPRSPARPPAHARRAARPGGGAGRRDAGSRRPPRPDTRHRLLQHGYAHTNHAPPGDKKIELGPHRPAMFVLGELGTGRLALERLFGSRVLPVLVPPWNRIAPALVPTLPEIGYRGLSAFGPRAAPRPGPGLLQVNTHIDLIDWKTRRLRGRCRDACRVGAGTCRVADRYRRAGRPAQPSSCDGRSGVGFLTVVLGKTGEHARGGDRPGYDLFASREARV